MIQLAGGSIPGADHTKPGQPGWTNNHDAFTWRQLPDGTVIAIVSDGCGSGKHSEVGSQLGVQIVANLVAVEWEKIRGRGGPKDLPWQRIKQMAVAQLTVLAQAMGGSTSATVNEYFLFTIVGAVVTPEEYCVFHLGDGLYALNGTVTNFGPFPQNAPPYLMYNLTGTSLSGTDPAWLDFRIALTGPTSDLQWLLLGTDGVADLIALRDTTLPGRDKPVGPIDQFAEEKFFGNADLVRRHLAMMNRETVEPKGGIRPGLLKDDTTFVIIRNTPT